MIQSTQKKIHRALCEHQEKKTMQILMKKETADSKWELAWLEDERTERQSTGRA